MVLVQKLTKTLEKKFDSEHTICVCETRNENLIFGQLDPT